VSVVTILHITGGLHTIVAS